MSCGAFGFEPHFVGTEPGANIARVSVGYRDDEVVAGTEASPAGLFCSEFTVAPDRSRPPAGCRAAHFDAVRAAGHWATGGPGGVMVRENGAIGPAKFP